MSTDRARRRPIRRSAPSTLILPSLMSRTAGGLYLFGGILGTTVTILMPNETSGNRLIVGSVGASALIIGAALLILGRRVDPRTHPVLILSATVLLTVGIVNATSSIAALGFASLYVAIICDAAFFFSWAWGAVNTVFAVTMCMVSLAVRPDIPWWTGLVPAGVSLAVACCVGVLARIASDADIDALTGLVNKRGFDRSLDLEIARAGRIGTRPAIAVLNLDHFKLFNDSRGYADGDAELQRIADIWRKLLGPNRILARYGGDEFALLMPNMSEHGVILLADRMRDAIEVGCSAGVTSWQQGESASFMVSRAMVGLYRAKLAGRNRSVHETDHDPQPTAAILDAIRSDAVDIALQPIVDLQASGKVVGYEALVRWCGASSQTVSPAEIVHAAEENGLISHLGAFVLARACEQAMRLAEATPGEKLTLNVNASGLELIEAGFIAGVDEVLSRTGWPADQLVVEVTETFLDIDTPVAIANLAALRRRGIRIAIDDFGTGYSSLSRLMTLPTDILKLDASFVASIAPDSPPPPLLEVIAKLSAALGLYVIAEGVEYTNQATALSTLGYRFAQGYLYGRPQSVEQLLADLAANHPIPT
ncbi:putative bifunctional diguanylate cyclase/phosphodiesterase [Antrihabitans sp. NCIMB 15449]|uniref:Bifunctional diguanylate cyclase/phosphodiesterase n=1 Tax=Antrihabitans spumae TaxID=3373370 RepID=A0ABW7JMI5_9NOCA